MSSCRRVEYFALPFTLSSCPASRPLNLGSTITASIIIVSQLVIGARNGLHKCISKDGTKKGRRESREEIATDTRRSGLALLPLLSLLIDSSVCLCVCVRKSVTRVGEKEEGKEKTARDLCVKRRNRNEASLHYDLLNPLSVPLSSLLLPPPHPPHLLLSSLGTDSEEKEDRNPSLVPLPEIWFPFDTRQSSRFISPSVAFPAPAFSSLLHFSCSGRQVSLTSFAALSLTSFSLSSYQMPAFPDSRIRLL